MKKTYRVALIGCGWIGLDKHIPSLLATEDVELAALCDINPEHLAEAQAKFGLTDIAVYTDYQEMLKDETIDIVHIAVPNKLHCQLTCDCLRAGKHVLCEKPMATTKAECKQMIATAKEMGKKLTVGFQWRYRPEALTVKSICERKELGDIYYAKALATRYRGVPAWGEYLNGNNGGGVFIDGVPHALDLTLWAMDNYTPKSVKANLYNKLKDNSDGNIWGGWDVEEFRVEDSGFALVTMENGATIVIEGSWALNMIGDDMKTLLCGTEAGLDMQGSGQVRVNGVHHGKNYLQVYDMSESPAPNTIRALAPGLAEVRMFVDCIRNDTEPFIKPEEAMVVTQIIEGIYESASSGKEIYF